MSIGKGILTIVGGALLCSCTHKEIVCPGSEPRPVEVGFCWDKAPEADVDGMTVYFYPTLAGGRMWRFDIAGRDGGRVELPAGKYRMLAVNNDLPGVVFSGSDDFDSLTAGARRSAASGATDGMLAPTGMLYGGCVRDISVTLCGVSYTTEQGTQKECPLGLIRCYPDSLATVYTVRLHDVEGAGLVASASACIDGVAESLTLCDAAGGPGGCTAPFALSAPADNSCTMSGTTSGLGTPAGRERDFTLMLNVRRRDGTLFAKNIDISGQVLNSPTPHNVVINITGLKIPDGDTPQPPDTPGDVGIEVGVDGWQVVETTYDTSINDN